MLKLVILKFQTVKNRHTFIKKKIKISIHFILLDSEYPAEVQTCRLAETFAQRAILSL